MPHFLHILCDNFTFITVFTKGTSKFSNPCHNNSVRHRNYRCHCSQKQNSTKSFSRFAQAHIPSSALSLLFLKRWRNFTAMHSVFLTHSSASQLHGNVECVVIRAGLVLIPQVSLTSKLLEHMTKQSTLRNHRQQFLNTVTSSSNTVEIKKCLSAFQNNELPITLRTRTHTCVHETNALGKTVAAKFTTSKLWPSLTR